MRSDVLSNEPYDINKITKGNISIIEYCNPDSEKIEKVFIQNGILGFFATREEMIDLNLILNYYLNIEEIHSIT